MADNEQDNITDAISKALTEIFQTDVKIGATEILRGSSRSKLMRCRLTSASSAVPATVIVKQALSMRGEAYDLTRTQGPAWRLLNEWAGLQFLSQCFADSDLPVPRFLAGDRAAGIVMM